MRRGGEEFDTFCDRAYGSEITFFVCSHLSISSEGLSLCETGTAGTCGRLHWHILVACWTALGLQVLWSPVVDSWDWIQRGSGWQEFLVFDALVKNCGHRRVRGLRSCGFLFRVPFFDEKNSSMELTVI